MNNCLLEIVSKSEYEFTGKLFNMVLLSNSEIGVTENVTQVILGYECALKDFHKN